MSGCSLRVIGGGVCPTAGVAAASQAGAADAPPASDNDTPTIPRTGMASLRPFRFEAVFLCAIVESSRTFVVPIKPTLDDSYASRRPLARPTTCPHRSLRRVYKRRRQPAATVPENAPGRDLVPNAFEQDPGIGGGYRPMTADANPTHSCTLQKRVPLSAAGLRSAAMM